MATLKLRRSSSREHTIIAPVRNQQVEHDQAMRVLGLVGVERLTIEMLKSAWRRIASKYHPDKTSGNKMKFNSAHWAYRYLLEELTAAPPACPRCHGTGRAKLKRGHRLIFTTCTACGGTPLPEV